MTKEELSRNLGTIAKSGTSEFLRQMEVRAGAWSDGGLGRMGCVEMKEMEWWRDGEGGEMEGEGRGEWEVEVAVGKWKEKRNNDGGREMVRVKDV